MANGNYQQIVKFLEHIDAHKPKVFPKYYYPKGELICVINADKMFDLPAKLAKYKQHDEFYIQFNANDKTVLFYAFDIREFTTGEWCNEEVGGIDWDEIEHSFLRFLSMNLRDLSTSSNPYTDIMEASGDSCPIVSGKSEKPAVSRTPNYGPHLNQGTWGNHYGHSRGRYRHTENVYSGGSETFKERSAFTDKLEVIMREHKTSAASDFIVESMRKFIDDKKFDLIDAMLRFMFTDKMNITTMKTMLVCTRECGNLKGRQEFMDKFKLRISKLKPKLAEVVMRDVNAA
jgi:hypothetical protein